MSIRPTTCCGTMDVSANKCLSHTNNVWDFAISNLQRTIALHWWQPTSIAFYLLFLYYIVIHCLRPPTEHCVQPSSCMWFFLPYDNNHRRKRFLPSPSQRPLVSIPSMYCCQKVAKDSSAVTHFESILYFYLSRCTGKCSIASWSGSLPSSKKPLFEKNSWAHQ